MKALSAFILTMPFILLLLGCTCPTCNIPSTPSGPPSTSPKIKTPYRVHIVSRGETLWHISKQYGVNIHDIMAVNHIEDPTHIIAGTQLIIPSTAYKTPRGTTPASFTPSQKSYIGKEGFIWPIRGKITTYFGKTKSKVSKGIDIKAPLGAYVKASQSGKVIFSGNYGPFGKTVILQHPSGFSSVYAHNRINLVKKGQWVRQGQNIATVGMTGHAYTPTLHFEIRRKSTAVDPLKYMRSP
jgi:murein DD-endopeptidase MepM/ murein hydrolase activator NlpD